MTRDTLDAPEPRAEDMWAVRWVASTTSTQGATTESCSILELTTTAYPEVVDLATRMSEYIHANEPDALTFEWFGDEVTGEIVWYQVYANDEAFLTHAKNMVDAGFSEEARQLLTQQRLVLLTPLSHPQAKAMPNRLVLNSSHHLQAWSDS